MFDHATNRATMTLSNMTAQELLTHVDLDARDLLDGVDTAQDLRDTLNCIAPDISHDSDSAKDMLEELVS